MDRRNFLKNILLAGIAGTALPQCTPADDIGSTIRSQTAAEILANKQLLATQHNLKNAMTYNGTGKIDKVSIHDTTFGFSLEISLNDLFEKHLAAQNITLNDPFRQGSYISPTAKYRLISANIIPSIQYTYLDSIGGHRSNFDQTQYPTPHDLQTQNTLVYTETQKDLATSHLQVKNANHATLSAKEVVYGCRNGEMKLSIIELPPETRDETIKLDLSFTALSPLMTELQKQYEHIKVRDPLYADQVWLTVEVPCTISDGIRKAHNGTGTPTFFFPIKCKFSPEGKIIGFDHIVEL